MEELEGNTWYASEMYGKEVTRPILGLGYDVLGRKSDIFFYDNFDYVAVLSY